LGSEVQKRPPHDILIIKDVSPRKNPQPALFKRLYRPTEKSYNKLQLVGQGGGIAMSEQTVNIIVAILFFAVLGIVKNHFGMG